MLNDWKNKLTKDWHLMRLFRLGLAILVLIEAWKNKEILFAALGGVLLFQALLNVGCCGSAGCEVNQPKTQGKSNSEEVKEVSFEEIK